jgi:hypothetical protein
MLSAALFTCPLTETTIAVFTLELLGKTPDMSSEPAPFTCVPVTLTA